MKPSRTRLAPIALTVNEALERAPFGKNSLYLAINSGALPARKFGRRTIILEEDLENYIRALPPYGVK